MNNDQFRKLIASGATSDHHEARSHGGTGARPASFRARPKSGISMTPRSVRQSQDSLSARPSNTHERSDQIKPRFRHSAAPKGTRLAQGYHDRTKDRADGDDEMSRRITALEEQVKLGQLDQATFEQMRDNITGGDVSATHLVKGLDRKLLERVRRGEDVMGGTVPAADEASTAGNEEQELDAIADANVTAVQRAKTAKKGELAVPPSVAGVKRNRAAILAELKASRQGAVQAAVHTGPQLGGRFRKIGHENEPRIELDDEGREVLLVRGKNGKIKRKVRKVQPTSKDTLLAVDVAALPLGISEELLPQQSKAVPSDSDSDIFDGVGADYDPLADLSEGDSDASDKTGENSLVSEKEGPQQSDSYVKRSQESKRPSNDTSTTKIASEKPHNYFNEPARTDDVLQAPTNPLQDPSIMAAIRHAAKKAGEDKDDDGVDSDDEEQRERRRKHAAMLASTDRDLEDMDMGFGSSRFDDEEEDGTGSRIKLSQWQGMGKDDENDGGAKERGGKQRKRGPKKRKGDKNNVADVMSVLEKRKG